MENVFRYGGIGCNFKGGVIEKMYDRQNAQIEYDMLKGCINRMFVTDDKEELPKLYSGAIYHLGQIYTYGEKRLNEEETKA